MTDRMPSDAEAEVLEAANAGWRRGRLFLSLEAANACVREGWLEGFLARPRPTDSGRAALQRYRAAHPERLEGGR